MRNPVILQELVKSIELADATFARDGGERAVPQPRRLNSMWQPRQSTSRSDYRPPVASPKNAPMLTEAAPVKGRRVGATLDSGSLITLVRTDILPALPKEESKLPITCVHGDTHEVPGRRITIAADPGTWQLKVGAVRDLPVAVLLGRDWTGFDRLLSGWPPKAKRGVSVMLLPMTSIMISFRKLQGTVSLVRNNGKMTDYKTAGTSCFFVMKNGLLYCVAQRRGREKSSTGWP